MDTINILLESLKIVNKKKSISIDCEMDMMGFVKTNNYYHFNIFKCSDTRDLDSNCKNFIMRNYDSFVKAYCYAKQTDILIGRIKNNSLLKFLINAVSNYPEDAKFIMLNALNIMKDKKFDDNVTIDYIIGVIKNAGFIKDGDSFIRKSNWPRFAAGLDKVWLEKYVSSEFDKNIAWNFIKKHCWHNSRYDGTEQKYNIWYPKENKIKSLDTLKEILKSHLKYGGKIVMKMSKGFKCHMPFDTEEKDGNSFVKMHFEKDNDGKIKSVYLEGAASNNKVDRENDRMTSAFLQKMASTAKGLTLFSEHKHDIEHTLGYIEEANSDGKEFKIKAKCESPEKNPLVRQIVDKIKSGVKIGFSIFGTVLEADRVWDKEMEKEIFEISDGELEEVSVTAWPAAYDTLATAVAKSAKEKTDNDNNFEDFEKALSHNSKINPSEPIWSNIDKTSLPLKAHANMVINSKKKSEWQYPHHYVVGGKKDAEGMYTSGTMYLHKGGLSAAWAAANGKNGNKAAPAIISHLQRHRTALGLNEAGKALSEISERFDSTNCKIEEILSKSNDKILDLIVEYQSALNESAKSGTFEDKIKSAEIVTKKFAKKVATLVEEIIQKD